MAAFAVDDVLAVSGLPAGRSSKFQLGNTLAKWLSLGITRISLKSFENILRLPFINLAPSDEADMVFGGGGGLGTPSLWYRLPMALGREDGPK